MHAACCTQACRPTVQVESCPTRHVLTMRKCKFTIHTHKLQANAAIRVVSRGGGARPGQAQMARHPVRIHGWSPCTKRRLQQSQTYCASNQHVNAALPSLFVTTSTCLALQEAHGCQPIIRLAHMRPGKVRAHHRQGAGARSGASAPTLRCYLGQLRAPVRGMGGTATCGRCPARPPASSCATHATGHSSSGGSGGTTVSITCSNTRPCGLNL